MSDGMKSIIIIGGGIAGLSAGCYARMNGYDTRIFEMHDKPGGLCTAWSRKGYTFDGCIHWLVGSSDASSFNKLWNEVGAIGPQKIIDFDEFIRFQASDGTEVIIFSDVDKLETHLKEIGPDDAKTITEFCSAVREAGKYEMPVDDAPELMGLGGTLKMMKEMKPIMPLLKRWASISMDEFSSTLKTPALREAFAEGFLPEMPVFFMITTLAWLNMRSAGYPLGGSLPFARNIEKRYLDLGGEIKYKARVSKILVDKKKAVGVRLDDGTEHRASYIISAADGFSTIYKMLDGKFISGKLRGFYEKGKLDIFQPMVFLSLGVNRKFDDMPQAVLYSYPFSVPLELGTSKVKRFGLRYYNFDDSLAPEGKTAITAEFDSNFSYWNNLKVNNPEKYKQEKERVANAVVAELERRHPGITEKIEVRDVATPHTFYRYTDNWQGTYEGWLPTPSTYRTRIKKTLPGLGNFWMCGQWVAPGGGLPSGVMTGRHVIQIICHQDKKEFTTVKQEF